MLTYSVKHLRSTLNYMLKSTQRISKTLSVHCVKYKRGLHFGSLTITIPVFERNSIDVPAGITVMFHISPTQN